MSRRICLVTTELRGLTAGGIGSSVVSLGRELRDAGWSVTFLVAGPAAEAMAAGQGDLHEARAIGTVVGASDSRCAPVPRPVPDWAFGLDLAAITDRAGRVVEVLHEEDAFDIIEFPDYQGLGSAALRRRALLGGPLESARIVVRLHGTLEICMEHEMLPMRTHRHRSIFALERSALSMADVLVAASDDLARWYGERYSLDQDRFVVSPLPFESVRPAAVTPTPGHVVFVGKVQRLKGIDRLVDAVVAMMREPRHDAVRLSIAGSDTLDARTGGSLQAALERRIPPSMRDRIAFLGTLDGDALQQLVGSADVVVLPNRVETYCLVAYELLASGVPVVLSDIPAFDVVERERDRLGLTTVRFRGEAGELASVLAGALGRPRPDTFVDVHDLDARSAPAYEQIMRTPVRRVEPTAGTPLVSVVVPFYEMQDYIVDTVRSVLSSTYEALEVVVVDDGSPSEAAQSCVTELCSIIDDSRVRVVRKENGGLGSARNFGIAASIGDLVLPVDSDDLVAPTMIETLVEALRRTPMCDAMACYTAFFEDDSSLEPVDYVVPYPVDPVLIALENRAGVATTMFRRTVFDDISYDEFVWAFEDWSFWWSFVASGRRAEVVPEVLFHYRRRPGSMVKELTPDSWARLLEHVADRHSDHLRSNAVDVYGLVMSEFVATRSELHAVRRNASPVGVVDLPVHRALYREVVALRTARSTRLAAALRRGLRRVRHPQRPAIHDVRVVARPAPGDGGTEVWSLGVRELGSGVLVPVRGAGWVDRHVDHPLVRDAMVATSPAIELRWRTAAPSITWSFLGHPYASTADVITRYGTSSIEMRRDGAVVVEVAVADDGSITVTDVPFEADAVHLDG